MLPPPHRMSLNKKPWAWILGAALPLWRLHVCPLCRQTIQKSFLSKVFASVGLWLHQWMDGSMHGLHEYKDDWTDERKDWMNSNPFFGHNHWITLYIMTYLNCSCSIWHIWFDALILPAETSQKSAKSLMLMMSNRTSLEWKCWICADCSEPLHLDPLIHNRSHTSNQNS